MSGPKLAKDGRLGQEGLGPVVKDDLDLGRNLSWEHIQLGDGRWGQALAVGGAWFDYVAIAVEDLALGEVRTAGQRVVRMQSQCHVEPREAEQRDQPEYRLKGRVKVVWVASQRL